MEWVGAIASRSTPISELIVLISETASAPPALAARAGARMPVTLGVSLTMTRMRLAPARDHFDIFGHLTDRRAHAAFRHAVRTAEIEFDAVAFRLLDARQNLPPGILVARHHQ